MVFNCVWSCGSGVEVVDCGFCRMHRYGRVFPVMMLSAEFQIGVLRVASWPTITSIQSPGTISNTRLSIIPSFLQRSAFRTFLLPSFKGESMAQYYTTPPNCKAIWSPLPRYHHWEFRVSRASHQSGDHSWYPWPYWVWISIAADSM